MNTDSQNPTSRKPFSAPAITGTVSLTQLTLMLISGDRWRPVRPVRPFFPPRRR